MLLSRIVRHQISVDRAAEVLERSSRRVYQLIERGDLQAGDFQGSVIEVTVLQYKRKIDGGQVRRGRPRLRKSNETLQGT